MPGIVVRLKELMTRRKHIKRKRGRSIVLVNQSIKNSPIQKMTLQKGGKEGLIMKILTRSIIRFNLIQGMNLVKEKIEGRIAMKTKNTGKDHPTTNRDKERAKTTKKVPMTEIMAGPSQKGVSMTLNQIQGMKVMEKREGGITMKIENTEKDHPVTNRDKEMAKITKKTLVTGIIIGLSQKDMLQKISPT